MLDMPESWTLTPKHQILSVESSQKMDIEVNKAERVAKLKMNLTSDMEFSLLVFRFPWSNISSLFFLSSLLECSFVF